MGSFLAGSCLFCEYITVSAVCSSQNDVRFSISAFHLVICGRRTRTILLFVRHDFPFFKGILVSLPFFSLFRVRNLVIEGLTIQFVGLLLLLSLKLPFQDPLVQEA